MNMIRPLIILITLTLNTGVFAVPMAPNTPDRIIHRWTFDDGARDWNATNHVADLVAEDGVLRGRSTGVDASIAVRGLDLPADEISHVRIRMRSTEPGATQVYFSTSEGPDPGANGVAHFTCPGDNVFAEYEVRLEGLKGWGGRLHYFRIDPVNGQGTTARFEIDAITLLRRAPRPALVDFYPSRAWCAPGDSVTLRLVIENIGGGQLPVSPSPGSLQVDLGRKGNSAKRDRSGVTLKPWTAQAPNSPRPQYIAEWVLESVPKTACYTATLRCGGKVLLTVATVVIAADVDSLPRPGGGRVVGIRGDGVGVIEDESVSLHLLGDGDGVLWGLFRARSAKGGPWRIMGAVAPLLSWAVRDEGGDHFSIPVLEMEVAGKTLRLRSRGDGASGAQDLLFARGPKPGLIHYRVTGRSETDVALLRLGGPSYRVGEGSFGGSKYTALFPGIEFLGAEDRSSDIDSTGAGLGFRHTPPPFQITVPLMAVSTGTMTTGILWDALKPWHGDQAMPMATFASPNFLQEQPNHLMEMFVPTWPVWIAKNGRLACRPFPLTAGEAVMLEGNLFARNRTDIVGAAPLWYEVYGQPDPPTPAKPLDASLDTLMQGWVNTMYDSEKDAYTNHWRHGLAPGPAPWLKGRVIAYGHLTGNWAPAAKMNLSKDASLRRQMGSLFDVFPPPRPGGPLESQRADGSWGYTCPESVARRTREFTHGERDTLGREGETNLGLCAGQALPILRYAVITGDPVAERAGLKALAVMSDFRVPAGSQTWEVPMDAPDIYAASQALDCYALAYQLTNSHKIRRAARYWAYTGLPFLYAYAVPGTGPGGTCVIPGDPLTDGPDFMEGAHPVSDVF